MLDVTLESLRARRQEEGIPVAPDGQQRRLVLTKVLLKLRIQIDITCIVEEQVQLYFMGAGSGWHSCSFPFQSLEPPATRPTHHKSIPGTMIDPAVRTHGQYW